MLSDLIENIGQAGLTLIKAFKYILRGDICLGEISEQIVKAGVGSLFIICITAAFIGLAMSIQFSRELTNFGAEYLTGAMIATTTIRELAPVLSAIIVAARVGSAISAEIGSMNVSEQIDALKVLGVDPVKFLFVPRLVSAGMITPLLSVFFTVTAILSGMFLAKIVINLGYAVYLNGVRIYSSLHDSFVMLLKAFSFGIIIAVIATTMGLQVTGGAESVGNAATRTVVWSIILIFIFNYILTSLFFGF